jgi:hypothetical protein
MKCRGEFSPPERLDYGLGRRKPAAKLLSHLFLKGRRKPATTISPHLILKGRRKPVSALLSHLILKDHWSIPLLAVPFFYSLRPLG